MREAWARAAAVAATLTVVVAVGSPSTAQAGEARRVRPAASSPCESGCSLVGWGTNADGSLANKRAVKAFLVPRPITELHDVTALAAGVATGYALRVDSTVWAWGEGSYGELGDGTLTGAQTAPGQVANLTGVVGISAGDNGAAFALRMDGTVWAWGHGAFGLLGNGTLTDKQAIPVQVSHLTSVTAIASGGATEYALRADGTVWAWGLGDDGELGNGRHPLTQSTPVQVSGLHGITAIAGGARTGYALSSDGTIWAWGNSYQGALGNGTVSGLATTPVQLSGLTGVTAVVGAGYNGYVLRSDGSVWAWGAGKEGTLGTGDLAQQSSPVQVRKLGKITTISGGGGQGVGQVTYAVAASGRIYSWGDGRYGQLGNGTTTSPQATPVSIRHSAPLLSITANRYTTYALTLNTS